MATILHSFKMFLLISVLCTVFLGNLSCYLGQLESRIVYGKKANIDDYPHLVQIRNNVGNYICGGSIISDSWILTAGHCINDSTTVVIRTNFSYEPPRQENSYQILYKIGHPNLTEATTPGGDVTYFNIGLLKLERPIKFSKFVRPVKLFEEKDESQDVNVQVALAGWGCDEDSYDPNHPLPSPSLLCMSGKTEKCKHSDPDDPICLYGTITTCNADYGVPVISQKDGRQVGIVSRGVVRKLSVFTRVIKFRSWIKCITNI